MSDDLDDDVLDVLPLGPFPPRGPAEGEDYVDLGASLRDQLLCRGAVEGPVRRALQARLAQALEQGQHARASELLRLWVHTWPLAGCIDPARSEWGAAPSAEALAVLAEAARMVGEGLGWPTVPGTPWPVPPAEWIREQVGEGPTRLRGRGPHDLRKVVEDALGLVVSVEDPDGLPTVRDVPGERLAGLRAELARALVRGEAVAVRTTSPVPPDPASQLALGELRLEGAAQHAVERLGAAGAWVSGWAEWPELLEAAPAGEAGEVLVAVAEGLLTPGTPDQVARGELETTGWLVWTAPFRPVPVRPVAVQVLRALDGERDLAAVAAEIQGPLDGVRAVAQALVELGAATAV